MRYIIIIPSKTQSLGTQKFIMVDIKSNSPYDYVIWAHPFVSHLGQAIVAAVTSGSKRFFLGTDSAPHERRRKECSCGCAGIYNAPVALSLYAKVFEDVSFFHYLLYLLLSSSLHLFFLSFIFVYIFIFLVQRWLKKPELDLTLFSLFPVSWLGTTLTIIIDALRILNLQTLWIVV